MVQDGPAVPVGYIIPVEGVLSYPQHPLAHEISHPSIFGIENHVTMFGHADSAKYHV